ncbi:hypothetical protein ACFTXO_08865 [Streptomyces sp. NPDC057067]|nr:MULTISPECIES: hypothetical protein [Streptomyces]
MGLIQHALAALLRAGGIDARFSFGEERPAARRDRGSMKWTIR